MRKVRIMIIDRFEGDTAVIETDSGMIEADVSELPENAREGDVLVIENGQYVVDAETTEQRRRKNSDRLRRLFERG